MDLLQNENNPNNMQSRILDVLNNIGISLNNMKKAQEFFDFSKELNLDIIKDGIEFQYLDKCSSEINSTSYKFLWDINEENYEYSDRYILFLDAVGCNTIYNLLSSDFIKCYNVSYQRITFQLPHALSRRYDSDKVQGKIMALLSRASTLLRFPKDLEDMAIENPNILLNAGKYDCNDQYINDKLKLYALALAYNQSTINHDDIITATECIFNAATSADLQNENALAFIMTICFMVIEYSGNIKSFICKQISGKEPEFIRIVLEYLPELYFKDNTDKLYKLCDLIDFEISQSMVYDCIKTILPEYDNYISEDRKNLFLAFMAERYPKQYVDSMRSTETVKHSRFCSSSVSVCNYYNRMYKILEKSNPKVIKDYGIDFNEDILKLTIITEQENTQNYKNEIGKYLSGESDISVLEPYFDKLADDCGIGCKNEILIHNCLEVNPKFSNRYIALKSIQDKRTAGEILRYSSSVRFYSALDDMYIKMSDRSRDKIYDFANILISENVPVSYRFEFYESVYEYFYEIEERSIAKCMASMSEILDSEYESICKSGEVFKRKTYVRYLELSNNENNNKGRIIDMCFDSSKQVRELLTEIISEHKEYESDVIGLLKSKKSSIRETAVNILSKWGADNYKGIFIDMANNEKSEKLAEKIRRLLNISVPTENIGNGGTEFVSSPVDIVKEMHKGGRIKKVSWLYETPNSVVHFENGTEADDKYIQAVMLCYSGMTTLGISENANLLAKSLNHTELNKFAVEIFTKWIEQGADAKRKWILYFSAIHGGNIVIDVFLHYIKQWSENSRGAIASEAVKALALNGSSEALMAVDNMAHKFKHKQVKSAAVQALNNAAEELGITPDELGDRIVPNLGFSENMERIFDYGTRKFKVYLTSALEIEVYDENDKKMKNLPAPSKKDDEETAKKSNAEFKQMKKLLKNVVSIQKFRLENALLINRKWNKEAWNNLFVKNPVMHSFAIGLIWTVYEDDKLIQTFRYMEDGSFNTSDENEYIFPENCTIGLAHPIDMTDDELSAWKEQLNDYEIIQPIEQLERTVYRVNEDEKKNYDFNRFKGKTINDLTLLGRMTKFGWNKGMVENAGYFSSFNRKDVVKHIKNIDGTHQIIENSVEFKFSGMYVGSSNEEVKVESVRFYTCIKRDKDDKAIKLKLEKVNPRYFSEVINQIENILKNTE